MSEEREAVAAVLARLQRAWRVGEVETLTELLHPKVVIAAPGEFATRIEGRAACIETILEFASRAKIADYAEEAPWIGVWGPTAAASYGWALTWEDEDGPHAATGQDVLALSKTEAGWQLVGRLLMEQSRA